MASAGHWSYMPINIRGACTKASKLLSLREVASVALAGGETRALKGLKDKGSKGKEERDRGARDAGSERRAAEGPVDGAGGPPTGLNRTGKSCRLRWVNYLHPGLKRGRMTPQEERLVLELHARWGNRWSRIARRLPGRTDNEIKNYWRTHMRKKAQERKRNSSLSSSSSSSSFTSSSNSVPPIEQKVENPQFNITGVNTLTSVLEVNDEVVKGYPMDQIWREIDTSESISGLSFEEYKDEACNNYCPPILSPMWDYSCDSLWKMDEEEFKMFPQLSELLVSNYQQSIRN